MSKWELGQYAKAYSDLVDVVVSMNKRGERAEAIVASIITTLARPENEGMLDFAAALPERPSGAQEIRGRNILDLPLSEFPRAMAESTVSAAINLCLETRGKLKW